MLQAYLAKLPSTNRTAVISGLFLAVLLDVGLHCLFSVPSGMNHVAPRCVSMVSSHCVFSGIVMLGGFVVVPCGTREMFRCFPVVFGSSVRHVNFSEAF